MAPSVAAPRRTTVEAGGGLRGEPALADAGLAAEQEERAVALAGALGRLAQPGELVRPADQRSPLAHLGISLGRDTAPGALRTSG